MEEHITMRTSFKTINTTNTYLITRGQDITINIINVNLTSQERVMYRLNTEKMKSGLEPKMIPTLSSIHRMSQSIHSRMRTKMIISHRC